MKTVDLSSVRYEEFIDFIFNKPIVPVKANLTPEEGPWYWGTETIFNPAVIAGYYIKLFTKPEVVLKSYSDDELEQGFWAIQGCNLDCSVYELMWMKQLEFEVRESVVRSMYYLFVRIFADKPLFTSVDMWWDSLAYDWYCENRSRKNGGEDELMQDVIFETLTKILSIEKTHIQYAALHGLGHLLHPDTPKLIGNWLESHSKDDAELKAYAIDASNFKVL